MLHVKFVTSFTDCIVNSFLLAGRFTLLLHLRGDQLFYIRMVFLLLFLGNIQSTYAAEGGFIVGGDTVICRNRFCIGAAFRQ